MPRLRDWLVLLNKLSERHRRRGGGDGRRGVARLGMAARRKLIVVSNRGPVTFARDRGGERIARRGGGGLVTALRSLVSHHDVTWIASAMTEEDRAVAAEAGGAFERHGARRLRLPSVPGHETTRLAYDLVLQRRLEPDALVPAALPLGTFADPPFD